MGYKDIIPGIYGLIDPITNKLRYIGLSLNIKKRYQNHLDSINSEKDQSHRAKWIKKLNKQNLKPELYILEYNNDINYLKDAEQFWIGYFSSIGCYLVNHTSGGEGMCGFRHSEYTKNKMAQKKLGKKQTLEHRQKSAKSHKGLKYNITKPKKIKPIKVKKERYKFSIEDRIKSKESLNKQEVRLKMSLSHIGQKAWNKGQTYGQETRAKISAGQTRRVKVIDSQGCIYNSLLEASKKLNCTPTDVRRCLLNSNKTINGLSFKRVE